MEGREAGWEGGRGEDRGEGGRDENRQTDRKRREENMQRINGGDKKRGGPLPERAKHP